MSTRAVPSSVSVSAGLAWPPGKELCDRRVPWLPRAAGTPVSVCSATLCLSLASHLLARSRTGAREQRPSALDGSRGGDGAGRPALGQGSPATQNWLEKLSSRLTAVQSLSQRGRACCAGRMPAYCVCITLQFLSPQVTEKNVDPETMLLPYLRRNRILSFASCVCTRV